VIGLEWTASEAARKWFRAVGGRLSSVSLDGCKRSARFSAWSGDAWFRLRGRRVVVPCGEGGRWWKWGRREPPAGRTAAGGSQRVRECPDLDRGGSRAMLGGRNRRAQAMAGHRQRVVLRRVRRPGELGPNDAAPRRLTRPPSDSDGCSRHRREALKAVTEPRGRRRRSSRRALRHRTAGQGRLGPRPSIRRQTRRSSWVLRRRSAGQSRSGCRRRRRGSDTSQLAEQELVQHCAGDTEVAPA
jgi:hypothetical protein